ncbi:MAG: CRISPR-associated endonuclease Cas2 [Bacteroidetes bacterium]|nr:CRISPR-associated endonuclease Cas2 [Bacteroidota bacterium]
MIVAAYDIRTNIVRRKVADLLIDQGFERVQKSVFEGAVIPRVQFTSLRRNIQHLLRKGDTIRYYFLCNACLIRIETDGYTRHERT